MQYSHNNMIYNKCVGKLYSHSLMHSVEAIEYDLICFVVGWHKGT